MLDSTRKQHKYLAKRKILMHYNDELNAKRRKELEWERENNYGRSPTIDTNNRETMEATSTTGSPNSHITATATTITPITPNLTTTVPIATTPTPPPPPSSLSTTPQPPTSLSNNYKIRLMENHINNNDIQNNNKDNNKNDNKIIEQEEEMEEEALNLAQREEQRPLAIIPDIELVKTEPITCDVTTDENCNYNDNNNNNNNENNENMLIDNDNNNNKILSSTDTDTNNNMSSSDLSNKTKHTGSALLNAINRNVNILEKETTYSDSNNNNTTTKPDNDDNNNHNNQLDLSNAHMVKNISATAEILCGLKSKVFKMEVEREAREREQEACRNRSEIQNAD